ncbi:CoA transferase subunit A [Microbispora catharanthi]|uniref:Acyl CoA--acetate/3-ketoacid CoA transferase subunit alpha n=1 Tax=Microbispora catharanthi TaxID=1712871 RepID=A0A5N6C4X6_9ACTN|nr:CoA-transferase [Microbispora catharanthi]KAB8187782.1 acyl CoA--acetate/3-ketoacid CoA transferase subunit alpha [Microbispora catharanthi]
MGVVTSIEDIVGSLESGMTIGIGGWGSRRKPMALVRAIYRSALTDLTIVSYGGPDVGLLCAAGKVRRVVAPFVTLDSIALEPHFRAARQRGAVEFTEYDEGMFMFGLLAAAHRLPFLPTRAGLGSDVMRVNPGLRTVRSPYDDGEELVAVPALTMDVALVHMDVADTRGNGRYLGPDPYMDDLFAKAAGRCFVSCDRMVEPGELGGPPQTLLVSRMHVTGVVETPGGGHFTDCHSNHGGQGRDEMFQLHYAASAADPEAWAVFADRFLSGDEAAYQESVQQWREEGR